MQLLKKTPKQSKSKGEKILFYFLVLLLWTGYFCNFTLSLDKPFDWLASSLFFLDRPINKYPNYINSTCMSDFFESIMLLYYFLHLVRIFLHASKVILKIN